MRNRAAIRKRNFVFSLLAIFRDTSSALQKINSFFYRSMSVEIIASVPPLFRSFSRGVQWQCSYFLKETTVGLSVQYADFLDADSIENMHKMEIDG